MPIPAFAGLLADLSCSHCLRGHLYFFLCSFLNVSSLALNILSYTFLLSASLCWIGWPFPSALAIQKNKRVYTNMPLIHFYEDHFEFVGEALGKDKKSYGEVFLSFSYANCKAIKSKKYVVLFYRCGKIKNVVPLSRADLTSSLDQAIVRASTK